MKYPIYIHRKDAPLSTMILPELKLSADSVRLPHTRRVAAIEVKPAASVVGPPENQ